MGESEDIQTKMLAAIDRLTLAVEKQGGQIAELHTNQIAASSVLEAMQKRLDPVQETSTKHQVDVAAQLKATQERLEARLAQTQPPPDAQRSDAPPRKVHIREGAVDEGMGVPTPTSPAHAPASPRPPPRASTRPASTSRPAPAPNSRARAASAPPLADDYPEVVLLKLPVPRTEITVRRWLDSMLASASSFPADYKYIVLPFHDYVTLSFHTVKDAAAATASLRRLSPTFEISLGDCQKVVVIRSGVPEVRRRNAGLQQIWNICRSFAAVGEVVKSIPRARGRSPHSIYYLVHEGNDTQRKICTAYWSDEGDRVVVSSILHDPSLSQESQDAVAAALEGDAEL